MSSKQDELKRMAGRAFVRQKQDRQGVRRVTEEEQRHRVIDAKTSRLRELREARDASLRQEAGAGAGEPAKKKRPVASKQV